MDLSLNVLLTREASKFRVERHDDNNDFEDRHSRFYVAFNGALLRLAILCSVSALAGVQS